MLITIILQYTALSDKALPTGFPQTCPPGKHIKKFQRRQENSSPQEDLRLNPVLITERLQRGNYTPKKSLGLNCVVTLLVGQGWRGGIGGPPYYRAETKGRGSCSSVPQNSPVQFWCLLA